MYILTRFCTCNFNPKILLRNFLTSFINFSYTRTDSAIAMATPMRITACLRADRYGGGHGSWRRRRRQRRRSRLDGAVAARQDRHRDRADGHRPNREARPRPPRSAAAPPANVPTVHPCPAIFREHSRLHARLSSPCCAWTSRQGRPTGHPVA